MNIKENIKDGIKFTKTEIVNWANDWGRQMGIYGIAW